MKSRELANIGAIAVGNIHARGIGESDFGSVGGVSRAIHHDVSQGTGRATDKRHGPERPVGVARSEGDQQNLRLVGGTEKIFVFLNGESKGALSPPAAEI